MNKRVFQLDAKDKHKTEVELQYEIEELKKKKNKDLEDIKQLKVEYVKLESLFKKFKEVGGVNVQVNTYIRS